MRSSCVRKQMTSKQRVLATIRGESVDKVPVYHLQFSGHACSVILGRDDVCVGGAHNQWMEMRALWEDKDASAEHDARCEADAVAITEACGMDLLRLRYWRWGGGRPTQKVDDRTFLFGDPDGDWYTMTYHPDVELFTREDSTAAGPQAASEPVLDEDALVRQVEELEQQAAACEIRTDADAGLLATIEKYPEFLVRHGGGTVAIGLGSVEQLMGVALWPDLYARLMMAHARIVAAQVPAMSLAGLEVNISGDDFCSARGPNMSPDTFRQVISPALKLLVDATHDAGMYYVFTSDGNFWPVADEMFHIDGIDGWMETDRSAGMDLRRLRETYPQVTFIGNIRVQVLHQGSVDDVVREVNDCMEVAHELGRVVVGASNLIMPGTPPENIHAMLREIERTR
jgi:uroporphyrinogen-III decarboxylase